MPILCMGINTYGHGYIMVMVIILRPSSPASARTSFPYILPSSPERTLVCEKNHNKGWVVYWVIADSGILNTALKVSRSLYLRFFCYFSGSAYQYLRYASKTAR